MNTFKYNSFNVAGHCLPSQTSEKMFICPESEGYFPYDVIKIINKLELSIIFFYAVRNQDTCGPKFWDCWRWHANLQVM